MAPLPWQRNSFVRSFVKNICSLLGATVQDLLDRTNQEVLQRPPRSTDSSPCDFHEFGPPKKSFKTRRCNSDAVREWLGKQPLEFYHQRMLMGLLQIRWIKKLYSLHTFLLAQESSQFLNYKSKMFMTHTLLYTSDKSTPKCLKQTKNGPLSYVLKLRSKFGK